MLTKRHILTAITASILSVGMLSGGVSSAQAQSKNAKFKHAQSNQIQSNQTQSMGGRLNFEAQRSISPSEAKAIARRQVPGGEVVDIKRRGDTYSVRIIKKSGKVVDVLIDANTGRVK